MSRVVTFRDAVADYLKARPSQWVDGLALQEIGGRYAWRSRVSDCRVTLGMTIENRLRKQSQRTISKYKQSQRTISEYRFVPRSVPEQLSLWSVA